MKGAEAKRGMIFKTFIFFFFLVWLVQLKKNMIN